MCIAPKPPKPPTPAPPPPPPVKGPEALKVETVGQVKGRKKKSAELGASSLRIDLQAPSKKGTQGLNIPQ